MLLICKKELLLTGFQNWEYIKVHLVSSNWNFRLRLGLPQSCCWHNLGHGSTVKEPYLPLEITLNYLWPLIPAIIINKCITQCNIGLPNLPWAHSGKFLKPTVGCDHCMHACRLGRLYFMHVILGSIWGTSCTLFILCHIGITRLWSYS